MTRSPTPAVRAASEPRYKGSWTASVVIVKPTATMARIQRLARASKTTDAGPQSIRYGEKAAVNNTTWSVIGKYRDAKAKPATANATRPVAVWGARRILDSTVQSLVRWVGWLQLPPRHTQAGTVQLTPGKILSLCGISLREKRFKRSSYWPRSGLGISCAVAGTGRHRRCSPRVIAPLSRAHRVFRCRAYFRWTHCELFVVAQRPRRHHQRWALRRGRRTRLHRGDLAAGERIHPSLRSAHSPSVLDARLVPVTSFRSLAFGAGCSSRSRHFVPLTRLRWRLGSAGTHPWAAAARCRGPAARRWQ